VVAAVSLTAGWAASEDVATFGWFLGQIAAANHWTVGPRADFAEVFRAHGIVLPKLDAGKRLTEGDVVAVGRAVGVAVTSQDPTAPFDKTQGQAFVSSFATQIGRSHPATALADGGIPNPASDNGHGNKKGHNKSNSEPQ